MRFNRPQAIRCLATPGGAAVSCMTDSEFQSPAGDSLSCDRRGMAASGRARISFNRPQAIRCLATLEWKHTSGDGILRFNRPQAIRCLATRSIGPKS